METTSSKMQLAADTIIAAIQSWMVNNKLPFLVALDGGCGAGKSTLARLIARELNATIIQGDDFYAAQISNPEWEIRSAEQRAADAVDWQRLRTEALEPLLAGKPAKYHAFDFERLFPDGTYAMRADFVELQPAQVIILDGAYSSRPELTDLIHLSVLVDAHVATRHERLAAREDSQFLQSWHARWDAAEDFYFSQVRPKSSFDLVVTP